MMRAPRGASRLPTETKSQYPQDRQPSIRQVMLPRDTNALGTIFGGVILSMIDLAAATHAHLYHPGKLVTVAFDQVEFKQPVFVGDLVSLFCETDRLGRTSICVRVSVWAQRARDRERTAHVTEGKVTLVAVDDGLKPTPITRR